MQRTSDKIQQLESVEEAWGSKGQKKQNQVKQPQRKITKLGNKVTKQKSEFEEKLASKKRKEMTAAAKRKELESETKAETSLQAQVVELENKLKKCQLQMSEQEERFGE